MPAVAREARFAHNHILQGDGGLKCPACILVRPEVMNRLAFQSMRGYMQPALIFGSPRQPGTTVEHNHVTDAPCNNGCTIIPVT